jgi:hypothetical protein
VTAIPGGCIEYPRAFTFNGAGPSTTTLLMDAVGEQCAFVFRAPRTGDIDVIGLGCGASTQLPSNGILVSLQNVDLATGFPDGMTQRYCIVPRSNLSANTWFTTGPLTTDGTPSGTRLSVTRGDLIAVVVDFVSFVAGDNVSIVCELGYTANEGTFPYVLQQVGAGWAKGTNTVPLLAIRYSDGTYYPIDGAFPWSGFTTLSLGLNTTPDEVGNRFSLPFDAKVGGVWVRRQSTATRDVLVRLYDSDGTVFANGSVLEDGDLGTGATRYVTLPAEIPLKANTVYRATCVMQQPVGLNFYGADVASAPVLNAVAGGQQMYWTQRTDGGAWTDVLTRRMLMGLLLTDINTGGVSRARVVNAGGGFITGGGCL